MAPMPEQTSPGASDPGSGDAGLPVTTDATDAATCHADVATDSANCGRCGHDCGGGDCQSGVCQPVVVTRGIGSWVEHLAVDTTDVYFVATGTYQGGNGSVRHCPLAGCVDSGIPILSGVESPRYLTSNANTLFFATGDGVVMSCAKPACTSPKVLAVEPTGRIKSLAVTADSIFWSNSVAFDSELGGVNKCPITGCPGDTPIVVVSGQKQPRSVVADSTFVYFATMGFPDAPATVAECPVAGCGSAGPTVLSYDESDPGRLTLAGGRLLWESGGALKFCATHGCNHQPGLVTTTVTGISGIVVDGSTLYYAVDGVIHDGSIKSCPLTGCPTAGRAPISSAENFPSALTAGATSLYWAKRDGELRRITKP